MNLPNQIDKDIQTAISTCLGSIKSNVNRESVFRKTDSPNFFVSDNAATTNYGTRLEWYCDQVCEYGDLLLKSPEYFSIQFALDLKAALELLLMKLGVLDRADSFSYGNCLREVFNEMNVHIIKMKDYLPAYTSVLVLKSGALQITEHIKEDKARGEEMSKKFDRQLEAVEAFSSGMEVNFKDSMKEMLRIKSEIEEKARETATRVSVKQVLGEFEGAKKGLDGQVIGWGVVVVGAVIAMGFYVFNLKFNIEQSVDKYWILKDIPQLVQISFIGAISSFAIKMLRISINLRALNLHRIRVVNSFDSFYHSVDGTEQRAAIVNILVHTITDMPVTGLIEKGNDSLNITNMAVETLKNAATKGKD